MAPLSSPLQAVCSEILEWDFGPRGIDVQTSDRVLDQIFEGFPAGPVGSADHRRLVRLCLNLARRAVACWDLYCDGRGPHEALAAVEHWLIGGDWAPDSNRWEEAAIPSYQGVRIVDCRECDTRSASESAAAAVRFARRGDPEDARDAVGSAWSAFEQSPLWRTDHLPQWIASVAVPAAWEDRDLTREEQEHLRSPSA